MGGAKANPFDHERPRALSYTDMMNSGQQRLIGTPKGDDLRIIESERDPIECRRYLVKLAPAGKALSAVLQMI